MTFDSEGATEGHGYHYAPDPFRVSGALATGLLEIVDTPEGERMRLRVSKHAEGPSAEVVIDRPNAPQEVLSLSPSAGDHHTLRSTIAPAEPHEFTAKLRLKAGTTSEEFSFAMAQPAGRQH